MQGRSSQECVFYICLQVGAKYMNTVVRDEDGICLNIMIDGDVDLTHRLCQGTE